MKPAGFTLIEMLVAVALTAVVMAAAMQLMAGFAATARAAANFPPVDTSRDASERILRADVWHAESIVFKEGTLSLVGQYSINADTGQVSHQPVEVHYRIEEYGAGASALVRIERSRLPNRSSDYSRTILFFEAKAISLLTKLSSSPPDQRAVSPPGESTQSGIIEITFLSAEIDPIRVPVTPNGGQP